MTVREDFSGAAVSEWSSTVIHEKRFRHVPFCLWFCSHFILWCLSCGKNVISEKKKQRTKNTEHFVFIQEQKAVEVYLLNWASHHNNYTELSVVKQYSDVCLSSCPMGSCWVWLAPTSRWWRWWSWRPDTWWAQACRKPKQRWDDRFHSKSLKCSMRSFLAAGSSRLRLPHHQQRLHPGSPWPSTSGEFCFIAAENIFSSRAAAALIFQFSI